MSKKLPTLMMLFVLFFLMFNGFSTQDVSDVTITNLSNSPIDNLGDQISSIGGGTTFYIEGTGWNQIASNNYVLVGPYQAKVIGVNSVFLIFESPAVPNIVVLTVSVVVITPNQQRKESTCHTDCHIYYTTSGTSEMFAIHPRSAGPTELVTFYGIHRYVDTTNILKITIGPFICDRLDLDDVTSPPYIPYAPLSGIQCRVAIEMSSGEYTADFKVTNRGYAIERTNFQGTDILGNMFNFKCIPYITSISNNIGSPNGQILVINGFGFDQNASAITVLAGNYNCQVLQASLYQITCQVGNVSLNQTVYIKGSGIEKWVYNATSSIMNLVKNGIFQQNFWSNKVILPLFSYSIENAFDRVPAETEDENLILEAYKAYFKAPYTGNYRFYLTSNEDSELYLSNVANSNNTSYLNKIAYQYNIGPYRIPYFYAGQISSYIPLVAGQFYLMNGFRDQYTVLGSTSYLWVGVEVPFKDPTPAMTMSVQNITVTFNPQMEVQQLSIYNYKLNKQYLISTKHRNNNGGIVVDSQTKPLMYNMTAYDLQAHLTGDMGWGCNVTRYPIDKYGNIFTNQQSSSIAGYTYFINFTSYRNLVLGGLLQPMVSLIDTSDFSVIFSMKQIVAPSDSISGNMTLSLNGTLFNIPGNETDLTPYFANINGINDEFYTHLFGYNYQNHTYIVRFSGLSNCPLLTLVRNELQGGMDTPKVIISSVVNSSNNLYFDPIPNDMLYTLSDKPQVLVSASNIMGKCPNNNCDYSINSTITPQLDSFNVTSNGLSLSLSNYYYVAINNQSTIINFAGSLCNVDSVNLPIITCQIVKNSDNRLNLEAGIQRPTVHIDGIGYTTYGSLIKDITIPLNLSSLSPSNGSSQGGQIVIINGSGFPISSKSLNTFTVQVGGRNCQILQNANNFVKVSIPPKIPNTNSKAILTIAMNQFKVNASFFFFQYNDSITPIISSLLPKTSSPSQKSLIAINGAGFGSDPSKISVGLLGYSNTSINYQLAVINVTDTLIYAVLGGGRLGTYHVQVQVLGVGFSMESQQQSSLFSYDLAVTSTSPSIGSIYGGTIITILGNNFSPVMNQNQILIGNNNFCDIIFSNFTCILCQTRPAPSNLFDISQTIMVTQRIQDNAVCKSPTGCSFRFVSSISPAISTSNVTAQGGNTVTLQGINFSPQMPNNVVINFINGTSQNMIININVSVVATKVSTNSLSFIMPTLREGAYNIRVYIGNLGWASTKPGFAIINPLNVSSMQILGNVSPTTGGSYGGLIITLYGNGFYNESIYINRGYRIFSYGIVYSVNSTAITFSTGQLGIVGTYRVGAFRNSANQYTCSNCYFFVKKSIILNDNNCTDDVTSSFVLSGTGSLLNSTTKPIIATLDLLDAANDNLIISYYGTVLQVNSSYILISFNNIPSENYNLNLYYAESGFAFIQTTYRTINVVPSFISMAGNLNSIASSFMGGRTFSISGVGFPTDWSSSSLNNISICGSICPIVDNSFGVVDCSIPALIFDEMVNFYNMGTEFTQKQLNYQVFSDSPTSKAFIDDNKLNTYYDSANDNCFILFDFGTDFNINLTEILYYPSLQHAISDFYGMKFQGSNDNVNFDDLFTMDQSIKTGWNTWESNGNLPLYRYFQVVSNASKPVSRCNFAEIQFYGISNYVGTTTSSFSTSCNALIQLNGKQIWLNNSVVYAKVETPVVQTITPPLGPTSGGTVVTLTGTGFGTDLTKVIVLLDDINCKVTSLNAKTITCITGMRPGFVTSTTEVIINGNNAIVNANDYLYIDRWSNPKTWGGEAPPRNGDNVYIPAGQNVLLDESTALLYSVIIEGSLIFEDKDMTFDAYYLVCMGGSVQIGTFKKPFLSKLTITMHGNKYYPRQLPEYGNKVWAFHQATLDMHGAPKRKTWTVLAQTAEISATTIKLAEPVDWSVNDVIAIASTDFNHNNSESRTIIAISSDNKTLTLCSPLKFRHYSQIETYDSVMFPMQAEVALLTRNILFQGSIDDISPSPSYGAHIMLHMQGTIGRISYTEFTNVGQGQIIGRYPMHFHLIKDASDSFVIGNSVHASFARIVAIHSTFFLTVQRNVGYRVYGHNYFIEDGIETNNLIENNLGISTLQIWTLLMSDTTATTYWISNPNNIIRNNRAAGGDWFGYWYQLENTVTGPSSNPDVCPNGVALGEFNGNIAHSFRNGLRINTYVPRTFPCIKEYHISNFQTNQWYAKNPPIHAVFKNFTSFKNWEYGLKAIGIGSLEFNNFLIAESRFGAMEIVQTNYTREDEAQVNGAIIVGLSKNPDPDTNRYLASFGISTPRTDFLLVNNVSFYNFFDRLAMYAIRSCTSCRLAVTGGKTTKFSSLKFTNVSKRIFWGGNRIEIFVDLDGSLSGTGSKGMLTPWYPHLDGVAECMKLDRSIFDNSIFCNSNIQLRSVMFTNVVPSSLRDATLRILRIPNLNYNLSLSNLQSYTFQGMPLAIPDKKYSWDAVFATGYLYNLHWEYGSLDFSNMMIYPSPVWKPTDKGIVFRFNYTSYREDYAISIMHWNGTVLNTTKYDPKNTTFHAVANDYIIGDYILDTNNKTLSLGINGLDNGTVQVNTIYCKLTCPVYNSTTTPKETFTRLWSNASMWPNGTLPQDGDVVLIPQTWNVQLDIDTANLARLMIDGNLFFDPTRKLSTLTSALIWVRLGNLTAGTPTTPFPNKIVINITGDANSPNLVIDNFLMPTSKKIVVTGSLGLYGVGNKFSYSRLASIANVGDKTITVNDNVDWNVGDQIVIPPTELNGSEYETKTIVAITNSKTITLDSPLSFFHYGDKEVTYTSSFGTVLDMRASVGLLTRSIKITSDPSVNWGAHIVVYQYTSTSFVTYRGNAQLAGVEISYGGQPNTEQSALDFLNMNTPGPMSYLINSSIHDGLGRAITIRYSLNVTIQNNVLYNCDQLLTMLYSSNYIYYLSNLLIAPRPNLFAQGVPIGFSLGTTSLRNSNLYVINNLLQGSVGHGFSYSGSVCGDKNNAFRNNSVNSVEHFGLSLNNNNSFCYEAIDFTVATTKIGIIANFNGAGLSFQRMILAENYFGSEASFSSLADENTLNYTNMTFLSMARPKCKSCYKTSNICQNQTAILIPVFQTQMSYITQSLDPVHKVNQWTDTAFDSKIALVNVTFVNYKLDYSNDSNSNYSTCQSNLIFLQGNSPDATARVYMKGVKNVNGDYMSVKLREPDTRFLNWTGGCGDFNCSGYKNWILTDTDGSYLGFKGQIIPQNHETSLSSCVDVDLWDARVCHGTPYGMLEFQNDGPDQRFRLISPVTVSSPHMYSAINEWKEWRWFEGEPMNMRLSRFNGMVERNQSLWMQFVVTVPDQLKFKLERFDEPWWVIISIWYERPNVIEVWNMKTNTFIAPFRPEQNIDLTTMVNVCGANIYDFKNSTITFVINSQANCILKVRTIDAVQLTIPLTVSIEEFYSNDGQTAFIDKISTFLGIDMSTFRIAVIGSDSNSVNVAIVPIVPLQTFSNDNFYSNFSDNSTDNNSLNDNNTNNTLNTNDTDDNGNNMTSQLTDLASKLMEGLNNGNLVLTPASSNGVSRRLVVNNDIDSIASINSSTIIIILSISAFCLLMILFGYYRKYTKVDGLLNMGLMNTIKEEDQESHSRIDILPYLRR